MRCWRESIAAARASFLVSGSTEEGPVPNIVAASWRRSLTAGVDASTVRAVYHDDLDASSRLVRCSQPIIERLSQETADLPVSIALTDAKARILTRVDTSRIKEDGKGAWSPDDPREWLARGLA